MTGAEHQRLTLGDTDWLEKPDLLDAAGQLLEVAIVLPMTSTELDLPNWYVAYFHNFAPFLSPPPSHTLCFTIGACRGIS